MNLVGQVGRVVQEPVIRTTSNGKKVANLSIVVNRAGDYDTAAGKVKDGFFQIEAWGNVAEIVENYVTKGKLISVSGSLKQHKWADENGNNREQVKIVATLITNISGQQSSQDEDAELVESSTAEEYDPFGN